MRHSARFGADQPPSEAMKLKPLHYEEMERAAFFDEER
jgi:hypothetical protein